MSLLAILRRPRKTTQRDSVDATLSYAEILSSAFNLLENAAYLVAVNHTIVQWNEAAERLTGRLRQQMLGRRYDDELLGQSYETADESRKRRHPIEIALARGEAVTSPVLFRHEHGHCVSTTLRVQPLYSELTRINGAMATLTLSTEPTATLVSMDAASASLVVPSPMVRFLQRHRGVGLMGVIVIRVDNLACIVNNYGHEAATRVLEIVEKTLMHAVRAGDLVVRFREDCFILLTVTQSQAQVESIAQRLQPLVNSTSLRWWGNDVKASTSFGVTIIDDRTDIRTALAKAWRASHSLAFRAHS